MLLGPPRRARPRGAPRGNAALLVLALAGCEPQPSTGAPAPASAVEAAAPETMPQLEVTLVGCRGLVDGACVFVPGEADELRLWAPVHPDRPLTATIDGEEVQGLQGPTGDGAGQRLVLSDLPAESGRLTLASPGRRSWSIDLRAAGEPSPAEAAATAARERADAAFLDGDHRRALQGYEVAMEQLLASDLHRSANDIAVTATYLCAEVLLDLACAEAWLARHRELFDRFPEAELRHTLYRGNVAERRGDLRQALADYREHADFALRLGLDRNATAALSATAMLSGRLGDIEGSAAALKQAAGLTGGRTTLDYARLLNNTAWTWILARDHGLPTDDPRPLLREALTRFGGEERDPEEAELVAHMLINLAFAELLAGDAAAADGRLREAATMTLTIRQSLWRDYIAARLAAHRGDAEAALRRFTALARAAAEAQRGELRIRALVGRGEALVALGRREAAVDALLLAERALGAHLGELALDGSRERYAALNDRSSRRAVSLLLELGRPRRALCVARLARGRAYEALARRLEGRSGPQRRALARYQETRATIEAAIHRSWTMPRRDGELLRAEERRLAAANLRALDRALAEPELAPIASTTCEELARPEHGELLLALLPGVDGWLGFAALDGRIEAAQLHLPPADASPEAWSEALLGPFAGLLEGAERLRVITDGELLQVPIHGLPFAGAPLFARLPVAYALDLAERGPREPPQAKRALTVAPPSNLRHAEAEADAVAARLEERGWIVEPLEGERATGAALRERMGAAAVLHFVGHAHADPASPWDDALELAAGTSLTIPDLIAQADPSPRIVVLNGCRTGLADPRAAAGGMSLAHALLVAGSEAVIATTEDIDDAAALRLTEALYDGLERAPAFDAAAALALALQEGCEGPTCLSYRAWIR